MPVQDNLKNVRMFEISTKKEFLDEVFITGALALPAVDKWVYVLHDKDKDDNDPSKPKDPHWHIYVKLKYPQKICHIASWFNVPQNFVGYIKGKWSDALKYAIHENDKNKYQYPVEEVKCSEGFDWVKEKDRGFSSRLGEIISLIETGTAREFNITDFVKANEYVQYATQIRKAFDYRRKLILKGGGKNMEVIFITGASGVGKTTYAKETAKQMNFSYFIAGGTNDPFDSYEGQDCVILDDLRPDEHHISDLLKMTDNNTASLVRSRFHNKVVNEVKLMIITSVLKIEDFYKTALMSEPGLAIQLCRRVYGYIKMTKEFLIFSVYNQKTGMYDEAWKIENAVKKTYELNEEGLKKRTEALKGVFLGVGEGMVKISQNLENYMEEPETKSQKPPQRASGSHSTNKKKK